MQIRLKILTPEKVIYDQLVDYVRMEAENGSFGVLPGHAPLAARLKKSFVVASQGKKEESFEIKSGFARVLPESVTVFA